MFITPSFHVGEITRSHRKIVDIHVESIIVIYLEREYVADTINSRWRSLRLIVEKPTNPNPNPNP